MRQPEESPVPHRGDERHAHGAADTVAPPLPHAQVKPTGFPLIDRSRRGVAEQALAYVARERRDGRLGSEPAQLRRNRRIEQVGRERQS